MLTPVINYLHQRKLPKTLSIALIYLLSISAIVLLILISYKPLITQLEDFIQALPDIFVNVVNTVVGKVPFIRDKFNWDEILDDLRENFWQSFQITNLSEYLISGIGKAFGIVGSIFGMLVNTLTVIVLSIYFIRFKEESKKKLRKIIPSKHQERIFNLINKVETRLGSWMRAQILLMTIIGLMAWAGMEIIGMQFSIPMGIMAGLLESIPNIGPMITWIIATVVAVGSDAPLWKIVFVAIWFILIQQIENYIIVPKLMEKFVGTNPAITIIAVLGASKIFGVWGALLAVPSVAILQISLRYYLEYKKENQK
jgi:predicted PurR-regulated permease PerM